MIQKTWDFKRHIKAEAIDIRTTTSCTHARSPVCRRRDGIKACLNPLCGFGWWLLHLQHKVQKGPGLTIVCCQHWNGSNRLKSIFSSNQLRTYLASWQTKRSARSNSFSRPSASARVGKRWKKRKAVLLCSDRFTDFTGRECAWTLVVAVVCSFSILFAKFPPCLFGLGGPLVQVDGTCKWDSVQKRPMMALSGVLCSGCMAEPFYCCPTSSVCWAKQG